MGAHLQVGLVGGSEPLLAVCREALACIGRAVVVSEPTSAEAIGDLDMMLLVVAPPHVEGVRRFGRMREVAPQLPVLLLTSGLDVDHAVELVKFGAVDLLELPASKRVLARKIERALRGATTLTIESPTLAPLATLSRAVSFENNRSCFRARVPERMGVSVIVKGVNAAMRATLVDLSLPTERTPAGMCLELTAMGAGPVVPGAQSMVGATLQILVEAFGRIVVASACVRRCEVLASSPPVQRLGLTFTVSGAADEALLQRIWVESQRRESTLPRAPTVHPPARSIAPPRTIAPPSLAPRRR